MIGFFVKVVSDCLDIKHKGFYSWKKRIPGKQKLKRKQILAEIKSLHTGIKVAYGSPRIHVDLCAKGIQVSLPTVAKIMKENGIKSCMRSKFRPPNTTNSNHSEPISANLLEQNFNITLPNKVYVTDITYIPYVFGFLYLCQFKDLCTKKVVGWAVDTHMHTSLVVRAFNNAVKSQKPESGLIIHSDRGSQYASHEFRDEIKKHGFVQSMSRKGNCYDNAPAESFFSTLKREFTNHKRFKNLDEARSSLFEYIEVFYNRTRFHSSIGYKSPVMFENEFYACQ